MVVSGDEKGVIKLWYTVTGQEIKEHPGHAEQIGFLSFASDNRLFTSVAMDMTMKTWNAATGQLVKTTINIRGLPFMASGNTFVAASNNFASNSLSLLDISNASEIGTFKADKGPFFFTSASFSRDGKYALLMRDDYNLQKTSFSSLTLQPIKQLLSGIRTEMLLRGSFTRRQACVISGKGRLDAVGCFQRQGVNDLYYGLYNRSPPFHPDGRFIVSTGHCVPTAVGALRARSSGLSRVASPEQRHIRAMLSPDGSQAIANSSNAPSLLWDIKSGKPVKIYKDYAGARGFVADGKYIFLQSKNNTSELWDIAADKLLKIFPSTLVGWSRDGPVCRGVAFGAEYQGTGVQHR